MQRPRKEKKGTILSQPRKAYKFHFTDVGHT